MLDEKSQAFTNSFPKFDILSTKENALKLPSRTLKNGEPFKVGIRAPLVSTYLLECCYK